MTYIHAIGLATGYGHGRHKFWSGISSGAVAAKFVDELGIYAAQVPNIDGQPTRFMSTMQNTVREAVNDAKERGYTLGRRVGLIHSIVLGDVEDTINFYVYEHADREPREYLRLMPSTAISVIMKEHNWHGPAQNVSATCSSGNMGIINAKIWLDSNLVDDVVCVTTDLSLFREHTQHFLKLGVASPWHPLNCCRPFQAGSRGFSGGEACVALILSNKKSDSKYASVLGYGASHDAYSITSIDLTNKYINECVFDALDMAGVAPEDVNLLNSHGTGTKQCNIAEIKLLDEVLVNALVYAIKPLTGHCQGASSALEVATAAMGYRKLRIPAAPRVSLGHPRLMDGLTEINYSDITVSTAYGLGGHNTALVLGA